MPRYSPSYYSPPRRGYGGGGPRSPPRRGYGGGGGGAGGGYGRRKEQNGGSLLVRNIPLDCRLEELRVPFERFGTVRDVYLPKDYYTGEPRGFAFLQFVDSYEASEAQYHMNGQIFAGRQISVVLASETRKRPEEMRQRSRVRGPSSGYGGRRSSHYGRSRSRSISRSRSPRRPSGSRSRYRSRSYSPAPRRRADYSVSPSRRHADPPISPRGPPPERDGEHNGRRSYSPAPRRRGDYSGSPSRRHADPPRSPRGPPLERDGEHNSRRSYSPVPRHRGDYSGSPSRRHADPPRSPRGPPLERDGEHNDRRSYSPHYGAAAADQTQNGYGFNEKPAYESEEAPNRWREFPSRASRSPSGSRSRSADVSPRHAR